MKDSRRRSSVSILTANQGEFILMALSLDAGARLSSTLPVYQAGNTSHSRMVWKKAFQHFIQIIPFHPVCLLHNQISLFFPFHHADFFFMPSALPFFIVHQRNRAQEVISMNKIEETKKEPKTGMKTSPGQQSARVRENSITEEMNKNRQMLPDGEEEACSP